MWNIDFAQKQFLFGVLAEIGLTTLRLRVDSLWVRWQNPPSSNAPVAQLDRAFGYEPKGRTFESCRAHNQINKLRQALCLPFFICDNLVTVLRGIARSHLRDGVALARIARVHVAHRGRDRSVPHQFPNLDHICP